jgi:hypothetical protein
LPLWAANAGFAVLAAAIAAPKISFETFAMISFSELCYRRAGDWITLPQIPSAFLNTMQGCIAWRGDADR